MKNPHQSRKNVSGKIAKYTLNWSPYLEMDRYLIHGVVPSEGGIFQIFVNKKGQLHLLHSEMSYYGGLRNRLRELIDPLYMGENIHRKTIEDNQCFVRYSIFLSINDMDDVMHFLTGSNPSGRYEEILVFERESMEVRRV
ncbi:hypothetical protein EXM22_03920 [Oceanispirochaeta crateris]|jgi:hypothetical protein|uniref:Uncharacterized protein n=1 Tax=Oceanispirochaeta crateris TaxID=2518645 RepID=A0A5C1QKX1_9SPIO|nr:hypothetical protein [Oceanispirochaeta crateris]QEN07176.1 hypothetical protein EXM22_03920 [Oceanispirochaeta crateris]